MSFFEETHGRKVKSVGNGTVWKLNTEVRTKHWR